MDVGCHFIKKRKEVKHSSDYLNVYFSNIAVLKGRKSILQTTSLLAKKDLTFE